MFYLVGDDVFGFGVDVFDLVFVVVFVVWGRY